MLALYILVRKLKILAPPLIKDMSTGGLGETTSCPSCTTTSVLIPVMQFPLCQLGLKKINKSSGMECEMERKQGEGGRRNG